MIDEIFTTKTKDEWVAVFQEHDVWHTVVAKVDVSTYYTRQMSHKPSAVDLRTFLRILSDTFGLMIIVHTSNLPRSPRILELF